MSSIRTIVVPHDFSEFAEAALDVGQEIAAALGANLHLLHVLQPPAYAYGSEHARPMPRLAPVINVRRFMNRSRERREGADMVAAGMSAGSY